MLSVPLPLTPHVHVGRHTVDPEESLPAAASTWEAGAGDVAELLRRAGFDVCSVSRAPYFCRGDNWNALYTLDAVIFACKPA